MKREWQGSELLECLPWLKRINAKGSDIYLRPLHGPELLLVGALNADAVNDMHRQGFVPAVTVETSPRRFQAWIKLSDHPLSEELRKHAVSGLAFVLPKISPYGRLAGFTNLQVKPNTASRHPFVLIHDATGRVAPAAEPYLAATEKHLRRLAAEQQRLIDADKLGKAPRHRWRR